ncbi:ABC transporter substrate-binding protein [Aggregatilinea lenta]|uniref:ABC transporter substrate-binding protein n=1 Tax=Aggregatilinea lenta TaxID=913108 RepID=UPI000E5BE0AB|nr:ABC transporter substrate-binding protein [Aggregatilinea lenta]
MHLWRRLVTYGLVAVVAVTALIGARSGAAQDDGFPRLVLDAAGREVIIPALPDRIAAVGDYPALAAVVPADQLIPVDPAASGAAQDIAGTDLLILTDLAATSYPDLVAAADEADVPVFEVGAVDGLDGWQHAVTQLGMATGQDLHAAEALARLDRRLETIRRAVAQQAAVRVLALTPEGYTFGAQTIFSDLVAASGGINVAGEAGYDDYRQVDDAAIRTLEPDMIVLAGAWSTEDAADFAANPAYADVPAVRNGRVLRLPFSATFPDDPAAAALWMAIVLHPGALGSLVG